MIVGFQFRSKKYGWGLHGSIKYHQNNMLLEARLNPQESSYYQFFLEAEIYRDCCYHCPYACKNRVGDLTVGDYWGVEKYNSDLLRDNDGPFDIKEGVSCILENSLAGTELLYLTREYLMLKQVDINKILILNNQLREPSQHSNRRKKIFDAYQKKGYFGVNELWEKWKKRYNATAGIRKLLPEKIKKRLKIVCKNERIKSLYYLFIHFNKS